MSDLLKVINPATQTLIRELEMDTPESVATKYARARSGQRSWARVPVSDRKKILSRFRDALVTRKDELANLLTTEVGKPISQSRGELTGVLGRIDFFIENIEATLLPQTVVSRPEQGLEERITLEPLGVIANISAWNYPYLVGANVIIPALLTGNAVLYKPSEFATLSGLAITELLHQAGVPKDVFIPVIGAGEVGAEILKQPIQGVFFTGSYATGKRIAEAAAPKMIKVQLELGGKDPVYVCDDVDVKAVADATADGAFYNTGQSCCSVERIYVHEKVHAEFVKAFQATVKSFVIGDPLSDRTYIGPLTREAQIAVLEAQLQDAKAKGAEVLLGGRRVTGLSGNYFEPTVLTHVNHSMDVMKEESFGPIIGIQKVSSDEEALERMNDTKFGLTAGIYTTSAERAHLILSEVHAGTAYWNCCDRVSPALPWSGRGHSGMGSTLSTAGIVAFTQPKAWHLKKA
ncbi:MAG: aldehyde dehydrogenase family protein [Methylotenera sp.]|nr:aldehyde dehydrogenase family protein [Oligoflexia bacterium]